MYHIVGKWEFFLSVIMVAPVCCKFHTVHVIVTELLYICRI